MNCHSIFECVVLIFILDYQSFPSIVVSFALSPSSEFHLVSLEVGLVLDNFNKPHPADQNPDSAACHRAAEPARLRGGKKAAARAQAQYVAPTNTPATCGRETSGSAGVQCASPCW